MSPGRRNLTASQAAARLGVSAKALRLYERQGLIAPDRSAAGWRLYSAADVERAADVIALRKLGLSLGQIARVLDGDSGNLDAGLAAHAERLRAQARQIATMLHRIHGLRDDIGRDPAPTAHQPSFARDSDDRLAVGFELPLPWGGEWFELPNIRPLTFITGPLGSGKTCFAQCLAAALPDGVFLGLDRCEGQRLAEDPALAEQVEHTLRRLEEDGAQRSDALRALIVSLEASLSAILVVDMVEQGLDGATQQALAAHLRRRSRQKKPLFLMTRSSSILDLDLVTADEAVILCPANHSPPICIVPVDRGYGYEAVATCLAPPEVRARTAGVIAMRPAAG